MVIAIFSAPCILQKNKKHPGHISRDVPDGSVYRFLELKKVINNYSTNLSLPKATRKEGSPMIQKPEHVR